MQIIKENQTDTIIYQQTQTQKQVELIAKAIAIGESPITWKGKEQIEAIEMVIQKSEGLTINERTTQIMAAFLQILSQPHTKTIISQFIEKEGNKLPTQATPHQQAQKQAGQIPTLLESAKSPQTPTASANLGSKAENQASPLQTAKESIFIPQQVAAPLKEPAQISKPASSQPEPSNKKDAEPEKKMDAETEMMSGGQEHKSAKPAQTENKDVEPAEPDQEMKTVRQSSSEPTNPEKKRNEETEIITTKISEEAVRKDADSKLEEDAVEIGKPDKNTDDFKASNKGGANFRSGANYRGGNNRGGDGYRRGRGRGGFNRTFNDPRPGDARQDTHTRKRYRLKHEEALSEKSGSDSELEGVGNQFDKEQIRRLEDEGFMPAGKPKPKPTGIRSQHNYEHGNKFAKPRHHD